MRSINRTVLTKSGIRLTEGWGRDQADGSATRQFNTRPRIAEWIQKSTNILSWFRPPQNHYLLGNSNNYTQDVVSGAEGQYKIPGLKVKPPISENFEQKQARDPNP
jgi:hypothetical protein